MDKELTEITESLKAIALMLVVTLIRSLILMFAWNLVLPAIFGLPIIGFSHALGLVLLLTFIIKPAGRINPKPTNEIDVKISN